MSYFVHLTREIGAPIIAVYRAPSTNGGICDSIHRSRGHAHHDMVGQRRRVRDTKLGVEGVGDFIPDGPITGGRCR